MSVFWLRSTSTQHRHGDALSALPVKPALTAAIVCTQRRSLNPLFCLYTSTELRLQVKFNTSIHEYPSNGMYLYDLMHLDTFKLLFNQETINSLDPYCVQQKKTSNISTTIVVMLTILIMMNCQSTNLTICSYQG